MHVHVTVHSHIKQFFFSLLPGSWCPCPNGSRGSHMSWSSLSPAHLMRRRSTHLCTKSPTYTVGKFWSSCDAHMYVCKLCKCSSVQLLILSIAGDYLFSVMYTILACMMACMIWIMVPVKRRKDFFIYTYGVCAWMKLCTYAPLSPSWAKPWGTRGFWWSRLALGWGIWPVFRLLLCTTVCICVQS